MSLGIILVVLSWVAMAAIFIITAILKNFSMKFFGTLLLAAATAGCIGVLLIFANLFFNLLAWLF